MKIDFATKQKTLRRRDHGEDITDKLSRMETGKTRKGASELARKRVSLHYYIIPGECQVKYNNINLLYHIVVEI